MYAAEHEPVRQQKHNSTQKFKQLGQAHYSWNLRRVPKQPISQQTSLQDRSVPTPQLTTSACRQSCVKIPRKSKREHRSFESLEKTEIPASYNNRKAVRAVQLCPPLLPCTVVEPGWTPGAPRSCSTALLLS